MLAKSTNFEENYFKLCLKCEKQEQLLKTQEGEIIELRSYIEKFRVENKRLTDIINDKENYESTLLKKIDDLIKDNKKIKSEAMKCSDVETLHDNNIKQLHKEIFVKQLIINRNTK